MKVTVVQVFIDKDGIQREIGEILDVADETRIPNLLDKKLVKVAETAEKKPKAATKRKKKVETNAG